MKKFFENKVVVLVVTLTILFMLFLALSTSPAARANWGKDGINMLMQPFEICWTATCNYVGGIFAHFGNVEEANAEIVILKDRITELEEQARESEDYKAENERLRSLLDLDQRNKGANGIAAEIIARSVDNWSSEFTVSKGELHGIKLKQTVITSAGLVGYISEVGTTWAKVKTILDEGVSVGVVIVRTQDMALTSGVADWQTNARIRLTYIGNNPGGVTGDAVQTSGLGGLYPKGLVVGTIDEMLDGNIAVVKCAVDFARLSEVLII